MGQWLPLAHVHVDIDIRALSRRKVNRIFSALMFVAILLEVIELYCKAHINVLGQIMTLRNKIIPAHSQRDRALPRTKQTFQLCWSRMERTSPSALYEIRGQCERAQLSY